MPNRVAHLISAALRPAAVLTALAAMTMPTLAGTADLPPWQPTTPPLEGAQLQLLDTSLKALLPQRPGTPDLYVLGVAGDASEAVFRNEVLYLQQMAAARWDAAGRNLGLINYTDSGAGGPAAPLATWESLGYTLDTLGQVLDPDEDILLLYMASHGLEDNTFYLQTAPGQEDVLSPEDLSQLLTQAGIGNAVIVVSACYSGGFIAALKAPRHMIITAARHDRPSFGCGNTEAATWFGRAFLVEALNQTHDFQMAFEQARATVKRRERAEGEEPSYPQLYAGKQIKFALAKWQATLPAVEIVPFSF